MAEKCRIITKTTKERCKNNAIPELGGFCRIHAPIKEKDLKNKWRDGLEKGALALTYAEVIYKLLKILIPSLPEFFGPGDSSQNAKHYLERELYIIAAWPKTPDRYMPGSRVDWEGLKNIYLDVKDLEHHGENANEKDINHINSKLDSWFEKLNSYHRECAFEAIEQFKQENSDNS